MRFGVVHDVYKSRPKNSNEEQLDKADVKPVGKGDQVYRVARTRLHDGSETQENAPSRAPCPVKEVAFSSRAARQNDPFEQVGFLDITLRRLSVRGDQGDRCSCVCNCRGELKDKPPRAPPSR